MKRKRGLRSRGRPSTKAVVRKLGTKMLDCKECSNPVMVDANATAVTCSMCLMKQVAPPAQPKAPISDEEKALRAARKIERAKRKVAKEKGVQLPYVDLGFERGWLRRKTFKTAFDHSGKPCEEQYFSFGKPISKEAFEKLVTEQAAQQTALLEAKKQKWPRGWWFRRCFVAPDGTVYSKGRKVTNKDLVKKLMAEPAPVKKQPSGFPRGWHFKKRYVHTDGSVWARGKQVKAAKGKAA